MIAELPAGGPVASLIRARPKAAGAGYRWFARNRGWINRGSDLIKHPQRDPREQLHHPRHAVVAPPRKGSR